MKFNKTFLATSFALLSSTAYAGHFSTEVTEDNYNNNLDYVVNVVNQYGGYCGGQLVAGKYVITAAHCLKQDPNGEFNLDWISSDVNDHTLATIDSTKANMTVRVGNRNRHDAQELKVVGIEMSPDYIYDDSPNNLWVKEQALADDQNENTASFYGDLAILTLESSYKSQSSAIINTTQLTENIDTSNPEAIVKPEAHIYGWGKTETGVSPAILRDATMLYNVTSHWGDDDLTEIDFTNYDNEAFIDSPNGSGTDSGDSGSPMHIDGKVVSWVSGGGGSNTNGSGSAYHIEWLKSEINAINTTGKKSFSFEGSTTETRAWTIPVQNLTTSDVTFTPSLNDNSGLFNITESSCEGTFASGADCSITVVFNENANDVTESIESALVLNDNFIIPMSVIRVLPPQPEPEPEPESDSRSSGGSVGFSVLSLLLLAWRRKVK